MMVMNRVTSRQDFTSICKKNQFAAVLTPVCDKCKVISLLTPSVPTSSVIEGHHNKPKCAGIYINYSVHLQESQIASAKFTKKVCECEDKQWQ